MRQLQQQHRQTRLPNPAADGLRHFAAQQRLMPFQLQAIFITVNASWRISVSAFATRDTHRGKLKRIFQQLAPHRYRRSDRRSPAQMRSSSHHNRRAYIMAVATLSLPPIPTRKTAPSSFWRRGSRPASRDPETRQQFPDQEQNDLIRQERRQTKTLY